MNKLAKHIVHTISQTNPEFTHLQLLKMEYGLVCIFSEVSKFVPLLILFSLLSLQKYFLIAFFFFGANRIFSGGYHAKTYWKCFVSTYTLFIFLVFTGNYFEANILPLSILLCAAIVAVCLYAPVDHQNKPILSPKRRLHMKYYSILAVLSTSIACFFLPDSYFVTAVISIITSVILMLLGKISYSTKKQKVLYP
jgi:accessory gene regulator B